MTAQDSNQDFFDLLSEQNQISDPFGEQEIFVKDASGKLQSFKGGSVLESTQPSVQVATQPLTAKSVVLPTVAEPVDYPSIVDRIVRSTQLKITDVGAAQRFRSILEARLRKVRNPLQTREALTASPLLGGLGLAADQTDRILGLVNAELATLEDQRRQATSFEPFADLQQEAEKILAQNPIPPKVPPTLRFDMSQPAGGSRATTVPRPSISGSSVSAQPLTDVAASVQSTIHVSPISAIVPTPIAPPASARPAVFQRASSAQRFQDVKFSPRLMGPTEELRNFGLEDFRRLAPTPQQAVEKLFAKIELLEEESFSKKIEGIKAWKESLLNRLYLRLGDESMESKRPIAAIIAERAARNEPTLTDEEFEVIMDFNQQLRY